MRQVIGIIVQVARRKISWRGLAELALWLVALLLCVGTLLFLVVGVLFDDSGLPTLPIVAKILALPAVLLALKWVTPSLLFVMAALPAMLVSKKLVPPMLLFVIVAPPAVVLALKTVVPPLLFAIVAVPALAV